MADKQPITAEDLYRMVSVEDPRISPDGQWIAYVQVTIDRFENAYKRNIWLLSASGGEPVQLTRSGKDNSPRWSPDGKTLAFTSSRDDKPQIYLLRVAAPGGEARALTSMPNGATSPAWSPDGQYIALLSPMNADERAREDSGEEDPKPADKLDAKQRKERKEQDETRRYDPRAIERLPYRSGTSFLTDRFAQIYVVPVAESLEKDAAKPRRLTNVDADHSAPAWTPDGQFILTGRIIDPSKDEPWRWSAVFRIRVSDASSECLTDETFSSFNPQPSPDGKWFAFGRVPREQLSERFERLAVMPASGGEPRDLTLKLDRNVGDFKWTTDNQLLFTALDHGNIELYRVSPTADTVEKIVAGNMHVENFDVREGRIVYSATTPENPSELYGFENGASHPLTSVNRQFLDSVSLQETYELRWQSPAGIEIQGWYMLPVGYQEGQRYPLAFNIHGGPHVMWGPGMKSMWHEWQYHAAQGYVVFYANPRGADGYGEKFQMDLHGAWGDIAYDDLMAGVDALLAKGFVDEKRMGICGGSYGGYMTTWIVGHTDRFCAAVAQRGVYNLLGFSGTTDIPSFIPNEFGVELWDDPMFLWKHSPLAYAHQIKTPLLLIHAENDFRVPISEAEQMFAYVRRSGGTVRLIRFPREGHELTRSGEPEHRVQHLTLTLEWFDKYCKV